MDRMGLKTELTAREQSQGVRVDAVLMTGEALHRFTHVRLACALLCVCVAVSAAWH